MAIQDQESVKRLYEDQQRKIEKEKVRIKNDIQRIEKRETELRDQKKRLIRAIMKEIIEDKDASVEMRAINTELNELASNRTAFTKSIRNTQTEYEILLAKYGAENMVKFADGNRMLKREMMRSMIERATITDRQLSIKMITGQTFRLTYPKTKRDAEHEIWEYDRHYIFTYIDSIQDTIHSTQSFQEMYMKVLQSLEEGREIGYDLQEEKKRFTVSPGGVVVIHKE